MEVVTRNAIVMQWMDEKNAYVPFICDNGIIFPILNKLYKSTRHAMEYGGQAAVARKQLFGKDYQLLLVHKDTKVEKIDLIPIGWLRNGRRLSKQL
jgi:hypothetical protein